MSGHTFRFRWTVQDLEVFLVLVEVAFGCERVKEYIDCVSAAPQRIQHHLRNGSQLSSMPCNAASIPAVELTESASSNLCSISESLETEDSVEANWMHSSLSGNDTLPVSCNSLTKESIHSDSTPQEVASGISDQTHSNSFPDSSEVSVSASACQNPGRYDSHAYFVTEQDWLDEFESLFCSENLDSDLKLLIQKAFSMSKDPFSFALYIARYADFDLYKTSSKKSLAYVILTEFDSWLRVRTEGKNFDEIQAQGLEPTDKHKDLALEVVVTEKLILFEPIRKVFKLDSGDNGFLDKHLRFLLHSRKKYKEVSVVDIVSAVPSKNYTYIIM